MIGTIICRNCDTAIEVSEGDVSKFQASPVFVCPVCQQNLAQRMADLVGGSPVISADGGAAAEDFTVPEDEEVYDGLPVGDSFDDAAARLKTARTKLPPDMVPSQPAAGAGAGGSVAASAMPVAPPSEDPTAMALRLAAEATAHAEKLARAGTGNGDGRDRDDVPTGVMPVLRADGRAAANAPVSAREKLSPSVAARAASPDPGVVPDVDRAPARARGPDEATPVIPSSSLGVTPVSPTNEATPALTRRPEPTPSLTPPADVTDDRPVPDPSEVTQRKMGAAPPKLVANRSSTLVPRTGTGPAGIGALGIRVANTRAVVQPAPSGATGDNVVAAPDVRVSGSHPAVVSVEASSTDTRIPSPPVVASAEPRRRPGRRNVPMLAAIAAGALVVLVLLALGISKLLRPSEEHTLVDAEPTVSLNVATTAAAETPLHLPSSFAPLETPVETPLATTTRLAPPPTAIVLATPAPTRAVVIATPAIVHTATPTRVVIAPTAPPTPKPVSHHGEALQLLEKARGEGSANLALLDAQNAVRADPAEDVLYQAFTIAAKYTSADWEKRFGQQYLAQYPSGPNAPMVKGTLQAHGMTP